MISFLLSLMLSGSLSDLPRGIIKNDADPWFIQMNDGEKYGCYYVAGSKLFSEEEAVFLEIVDHQGIMISLADDATARVYCVSLGKE